MKALTGGIVLGLLWSAAPALAAGPVAGDAANGATLARKWCSSCHLTGGETIASDEAPTFPQIANDRARPAGYLEAWLQRPHKPMPPLQLSRQEIADLVAFFETLRED